MMFKYIKKICVNKKVERILDLYCGCGSISLFIADSVKYVHGIELNEQSIRDANDNKELNNITNVDFSCDTTDNIKDITSFDTIIVDPPRSGLSKKVIFNLEKMKVKKIIYVSCNPSTLKRDVELLKSYSIKEMEAFNMFPGTKHIECLCVLDIRR